MTLSWDPVTEALRKRLEEEDIALMCGPSRGIGRDGDSCGLLSFSCGTDGSTQCLSCCHRTFGCWTRASCGFVPLGGESLSEELFQRRGDRGYCHGLWGVLLSLVAAPRARQMAPEDAVAKGLIPYLEKHIIEESGEDMLADLDALGSTPSEVLSRMSSPSIAALVGSQYYWVRHGHPVAVLGYIEVLEGYPSSKSAIEELILKTGLPRAAFRSLLQHAQLDVGHRDGLHAVLDSLPLNDEQASLLGVSALETVHLLNKAFNDVFEEGRSDRDEATHPT